MLAENSRTPLTDRLNAASVARLISAKLRAYVQRHALVPGGNKPEIGQNAGTPFSNRGLVSGEKSTSK